MNLTVEEAGEARAAAMSGTYRTAKLYWMTKPELRNDDGKIRAIRYIWRKHATNGQETNEVIESSQQPVSLRTAQSTVSESVDEVVTREGKGKRGRPSAISEELVEAAKAFMLANREASNELLAQTFKISRSTARRIKIEFLGLKALRKVKETKLRTTHFDARKEWCENFLIQSRTLEGFSVDDDVFTDEIFF